MSEESTTPDVVELTRRVFDASRRKDLDAAMSSFAHDTVWDLSDVGIGTFVGVTAIRNLVEDWWGTWADHLVDVEEAVNLGHGVVFACVLEDGRLMGSDGHVEHRRGWIFVWMDDTVEQVIVYLAPDHARAAAERLAEERE
jgi:ketosteroid isomerase-like protein